jgi:hypothetical protein
MSRETALSATGFSRAGPRSKKTSQDLGFISQVPSVAVDSHYEHRLAYPALFYEDLSPCWYFAHSSGPEEEKLKAVGWLAWDHPYKRRRVRLPEQRFGQLLRLLVAPWEPTHFMGSHECEFCPVQAPERETLEEFYERHRIERDGLVVDFGATNLFVPGEGCVYVAPSMTVHYVDSHNYEPPTAFWQAVMKCPEMGSEAYRQALVVNGPSTEGWARAVQAGSCYC